jgi:hypothetical protein
VPVTLAVHVLNHTEVAVSDTRYHRRTAVTVRDTRYRPSDAILFRERPLPSLGPGLRTHKHSSHGEATEGRRGQGMCRSLSIVDFLPSFFTFTCGRTCVSRMSRRNLRRVAIMSKLMMMIIMMMMMVTVGGPGCRGCRGGT